MSAGPQRGRGAPSGGQPASNEDSIKVFIRLRPLGGGTGTHAEVKRCLSITSDTTITVPSKPEDRKFTFDGIKGEDSTQDEMFSMIGRGVVENCLKGYNGTIFAYGQTGSGKTYTMTGPLDDDGNILREKRGLMPRCFEHVFAMMAREKQKFGDKVQTLVTCSFLEIYNERIYDLLDGGSAGLQIREDVKRGVTVQDLSELSVSNALEACEVLKAGQRNRRVASTSMNRESSRSHAVFTVSIKIMKTENGLTNAREAKLNMIDLAGSERQRDTNADGSRLKEAGSINKSLSALGNVIMALVDMAHGKHRHVAYRDSKLTFLLRDSLGGNTKTYMVANVSPASRCFGETLSTLQFAQRAKMIKNKAIVNEDVSGNVQQLQAQIKLLKQQLANGQGVAAPIAGDIASSSENELLAAAMKGRIAAEEEKDTLKDKLEQTRDLLAKKEKALQSTKMILKFRDAALDKMQKKNKGVQGEDEAIKNLKAEIEVLKSQIENNPEVTRFALQNLRLREELKTIKAAYPNSSQDNLLLQEARSYSLTLEKKVVQFIDAGANAVPRTPTGSPFSTPVAGRTRTRMRGMPNPVETPRSKRNRELELEIFKIQKELEEKVEGLEEKATKDKKASEELLKAARERELELCSERDAATTGLVALENTLKVSQMRHQVEVTRLQDDLKNHWEQTKNQESMDKQLSNQLNLVNSELVASRTEVASLKKEQMEAEVTQNKLQQEVAKTLSQLTSTAAILDQNRTEYEASSASTASELAAKTDELKSLSAEISTLKTELADAEEKYQDAQSELVSAGKTAQETIVLLEMEKDRLEAEIVESTNTNQQLQEAFDKERTERMNFEDELTTLNAELDFKSEEFEKAEAMITQLTKESLGLRTQVESLQTDLDGQRDQYKRLTEASTSKAQSAEITKERDALATAAKESDSVITSLRSDLIVIQNQLESKEKELEDVHRILADKTDYLAQQLEGVESVKIEMANLKELAESRAAEASELQTTVSSMEKQALIQSEANEVLESTICTLNDQLEEETIAHREQLDEVLKELDSTHSQAKYANAALNDAQQAEALANNTVSELSLQVGQLQEQLGSCTTKNSTLSDQVKELEATVAKHDATKAHLDTTQEEYLAEIASLKAQLKDMSGLLDTGEQLKQDKIKEVQDLKAEYTTLKEKLAATESTQEDYDNMKARVEEQETEITSLKDTVDELKCDLNAKSKENESAEEALLIKIKELMAENTRLESRMNMCEVNLDAALEDAEALVDELQRARDLEQSLYKEKEELQSKYEQSQEAKLTLEEEHAKVQHQLNELRSEADKLIGHQNTSQKIQLHLQIKKENNALKTEISKLKTQLKQGGNAVSAKPLTVRN